MNLTFPVADWLFGTSDLDRGAAGSSFQRLQPASRSGEPSGPAPAAGYRGCRAYHVLVKLSCCTAPDARPY